MPARRSGPARPSLQARAVRPGGLAGTARHAPLPEPERAQEPCQPVQDYIRRHRSCNGPRGGRRALSGLHSLAGRSLSLTWSSAGSGWSESAGRPIGGSGAPSRRKGAEMAGTGDGLEGGLREGPAKPNGDRAPAAEGKGGRRPGPAGGGRGRRRGHGRYRGGARLADARARGQGRAGLRPGRWCRRQRGATGDRAEGKHDPRLTARRPGATGVTSSELTFEPVGSSSRPADAEMAAALARLERSAEALAAAVAEIVAHAAGPDRASAPADRPGRPDHATGGEACA
jgi:hypothetical protein